MDPSGADASAVPQIGRHPRGRTLRGAAVSVGSVLLGIAVLLWVTDDPSQGPGPTVRSELPPATPVATSPASPPSPAPPAPVGPPPERPPPAPVHRPVSLVVPVTVLNNSRRDALAARAAARFERGGWAVARTGNFRGRIPVTTVYYDPGMEASARAFAAAFDGIARVRPRFANLPARGVVVVLTEDFVT